MKATFFKIVFFLAAMALIMPLQAQRGNNKGTIGSTSSLPDTSSAFRLINEAYTYINNFYVDTPDMNRASEHAVAAMLSHMDPHSAFIAARNVERNNEGLTGNFEGVGIRFSIDNDTIQVADVIVGGPAEKVGLQIGDKLVAIDGENATGDTINNNFVFKRLRGKKGTQVVLTVRRHGVKDLMEFTVVRDKVPIYSIEGSFMIDDQTGYIRLARFSRTSTEEFIQAVSQLKKKGMQRLVFDLRGNGGGYLDVAFAMADQFLPQGRLIVYQEGRRQPRQNFVSTRRGCYTSGPLIVLIDETSASASEIVAGALQDWDRATIIGRRSFGKGLVQRQLKASDGSEIRLTTARYYTPSGRCIQKPYDKGKGAYQDDLNQRYQHGELVHADSIHFPDSLKYRTHAGRTVYGGGGIMPDIFVPIDTIRLSDYFLSLRSKGLINEYANNFADEHRRDEQLKDFDNFTLHYDQYHVDSLFNLFAQSKGIEASSVRGDWVAQWVADQFKQQLKDTTAAIDADSYVAYIERWQTDTTFMNALHKKAAAEDRRSVIINQRSEEYLHSMLKALIASRLYGTDYYYRVMIDEDQGIKVAMKSFK